MLWYSRCFHDFPETLGDLRANGDRYWKKANIKPLTLNCAGVTSRVTETEQLQIMAIVAYRPQIPPSLWALRDFDKLLSDISEICLCLEMCGIYIWFDWPIPLALSVLASTCASFKNNSLAPLHKHCRRTAYCPAQISRSKIQSRSGQSQCRNSPIGPVHFAGRELIWVDLCSQPDTCHFCKSRRQCCGDQTEHLTEQVVCSHFTVVWFSRLPLHEWRPGNAVPFREWSRYIYTCLGPVKSAIFCWNVQLYQISHANVKPITTRHYPLWEVFIHVNHIFLIPTCESKITCLFSNPCSFGKTSRIDILQNCCFCEFCTSQSPDGFWSRIAFIKRKTTRQTGFYVS